MDIHTGGISFTGNSINGANPELNHEEEQLGGICG